MEDWAVDTVCNILDKESENLKEYMKFPQEELSQERLLAIKWDDLSSNVKILSPVTWKLFHHTASTQQQEKRNRYKTLDAVSGTLTATLYGTHSFDKAVLVMISMASMSRSHHQCKLAKLLTIYFRSCGLSAKAFDTLHALGITMSQKWVYTGINALARQQQVMLLEDIKKYPWFGVHDNINVPFRAFPQRIGNQNHFDSGTAATILVLKNPYLIWGIDLLQEHNVRDIKVSSDVTCYFILFGVQYTFAASGPNVSWDYIGDTSASIPCQRKVKDHVEQSLNHFCRGKSHTSLSKEEDVTRLQASYRDSRIHQTIRGRKLDSKNKTKDYLARGTQEQVIVNVIGRWSENRVCERSSEEYWEPENAQEM
jgi:hypothetical protein